MSDNGQWATEILETPTREMALSLGTDRPTILPPLEEGELPQLPLAPPRRPRFDGLTEIGVGGHSRVQAAHDLDIRRWVAIKRIREDRRTPAAIDRFVQEVRTIGRLDHPNIVTVHDVGREADGSLYFVMNYIDGVSLETLIERLRCGDATTHARWPFARRLALFRHVLDAVQFAHDRGIVHRDLKPANIMVGHHGEVRVVDWGLAKQLGSGRSPTEAETLIEDGRHTSSILETRAGALLGTPRYMAPEQARGEPANVRSDTFALCLVLYEWMTLNHYLDDLDGLSNLDEVLHAVRYRKIKAPAALALNPYQPPIPADLAWFIMDGLAKHPSRRYANVVGMIERLDRRADGAIPIQCPATLQKFLVLWAGRLVDRHPLATLLAASALLVALLAVVAATGLGGAGLMVGALLALS